MNHENEKQPRVTVGLMVYNEEKYLAETVSSILKQGFTDFEILIADNASVDGTQDIALQFAAANPRIRYHRHPRNLGALQNYNFLVKNAKGKYFVLAGGHDLWSPNYLSALAGALENNHEAVIAYAPTVWIDDEGCSLEKRAGLIDTSGMNPVARFNMVMWGNQHAMYGMYVLDELCQTRLQLNIVGSGAVLLGELSLMGDFIVVPEAIWFRRTNRDPETIEERLRRYYRVLYPQQRPVILPHWAIPLAYITSVLRGKMSVEMRIKLILSALTSLIRYGNAMALDIKMFFPRLLYKPSFSGNGRIDPERGAER